MSKLTTDLRLSKDQAHLCPPTSLQPFVKNKPAEATLQRSLQKRRRTNVCAAEAILHFGSTFIKCLAGLLLSLPPVPYTQIESLIFRAPWQLARSFSSPRCQSSRSRSSIGLFWNLVSSQYDDTDWICFSIPRSLGRAELAEWGKARKKKATKTENCRTLWCQI